MKTIITFLFCLLSTVIFAQVPDENEVWATANYKKKSVAIPMRDGVKLYTSVYEPNNNSVKHPVLLNRTPYSIGPYTEKFNPRIYGSYWMQYLKKGYIIVQQDVRGKWMSEGEFVDVRPFIPKKKGKETDEASDTYDSIDWLLKNTENNGNVGVFGISYPGFYSTMAALSDHPALKAVSPQAPVTDWFMGDDFHHNGAFCIMDAFNFYKGFGIKRPKPTSVFTGNPYEITNKDNYDFYLKTGAIKNFSILMGDSIAFWKDVLNHPDYDYWWKERNPRNFVNNLKPAMLVVGGLFDAEDCFGAWNLYKAIEKNSPNTENRLVMGPWVHGGWARGNGNFLGNVRFGSFTSEWYQNNVEIPFFEQYLNDVKYFKGIAEATVFFTGENTWKALASWPPKTSTATKFYLNDAGLTKQAPKNKSFKEYSSDPSKPVPYTEDVHSGRTREYMDDDQRFAARRPDVLVYETPVLENDLTVAGVFTANLDVQISSTDADFVVKLIDVFPENFQYDSSFYSNNEKPNSYPMGGYQMLVRGEIMRGKYRRSFEKPSPFTPGKTETVRFDLPDLAHCFKAGHKLMIQIQSSWFPLMDRNPQQFLNIYKANDSDFKKATIKILNSSYVELPVYDEK
jgi:putative CocE/NonD family hydrolase